MLQKAAQKLLAGQCHRLLLAIMGVILPSKGHVRLIDRDNPMIGYGNTMSVAGEILEYVFRAAKGWLGHNRLFSDGGLMP
jgi:hypothetical protein